MSTEVVLTNQNVIEFMSTVQAAVPDLSMSRCRCMIAHVRIQRGSSYVTLVAGDKVAVDDGVLTVRLKDTPSSAVMTF